MTSVLETSTYQDGWELMILARLQNEIHQRVLDLRSVELAMKGPRFERLYDASNKEERATVRHILLCGDKNRLKDWIDLHRDVALGEMSLNTLKRLAQRLHIKNYSRKQRHELTQDIECIQDSK